MLTTVPTEPRRLELILRQIDALPTLPSVATRLLSLTSDDEAQSREVIQLIRSDPSLTAKVLALCRSANRGVRDETLTVDKAVVLLGFTAIRNAVLSIKVFEVFADDEPDAPDADPLGRAGADDAPTSTRFDRSAFWTHSLAAAILAELIAEAHHDPELKPDEAFVCGLLHDIGKLALDHVLPKAFARVIEMAEVSQGNIADSERKVLGLDHHTAGKRMAQQWGLPHRLTDCIWLHGTAYESLPQLPHSRLISLINLADLIVRQQHLGFSGNFRIQRQPASLIEAIGLREDLVREATTKLHAQLEERGRALGLYDAPTRALFLQSIQQANSTLGRLNQALEQRSRTASLQSRILDAIRSFHAEATPGRNVQDVLDLVAESAGRLFGQGFWALLYPGDPGSGDRDAWLVSQYSRDGQPVHSQCIDAPPAAPDLSALGDEGAVGMEMMGILPWIADYLVEARDVRQVKLLPLSCGWGTAAVLLHDRNDLPRPARLAPLTHTWGAAIAAAAQHDGARRLGEQLAEANSALAEAQDQLLRQESLARLGEMTAGAAHEMNNPLAVIAGRSQMLSLNLDAGSTEHQAAKAICQAAHRLSDLITALHELAEPPQPKPEPVGVAELMHQAVKKVRTRHRGPGNPPQIALKLPSELPTMRLDPEQITQSVIELITNALQAEPKQAVQVEARLVRAGEGEQAGPALRIQVRDDGIGMEEHVLKHAMDPFFSAKSAGRRVGMGLARVRQIVLAHHGDMALHAQPGRGTTVNLTLPIAASSV
ncbi:MAG: HDOD domain-containing protein [Phycisphaeraceae bacterium]